MLNGLATVLILISVSNIWGQISPHMGGRQNGLGNAAVNIDDLWSVKNNPGAFAFHNKTQAGLVYQNRFAVSELSTQSLAVGFHTERGNGGLFLQHSGFEFYRSMGIGGTYALAFSSNFGMGITFNYSQTRFGDIYGVKHHLSGSMGVQYKLNDNISIGARALNINRAKVSDAENERLSTFFTIGLLYRISPKALWLIDLEKEINSRINVKSGLELSVHENFDIRLGVNSYPFQSTFGLGVHIHQLTIDLAAIWHSQIGLAPSLGIVYRFL